MKNNQLENFDFDMRGLAKPTMGYVGASSVKGKSSLSLQSMIGERLAVHNAKAYQKRIQRTRKQVSKGRRIAGRLTKLS